MRKQIKNLAALKHAILSLEGRNVHQFMPDRHDACACFQFGEPLIDDQLHGGLAVDCMHEIRCAQTRDIAATASLLCAFLSRNLKGQEKLIWVVDPAACFEAGQLYPDGLVQLGCNPSNLVFVHPADLKTAIWAVGEVARQGGVSAIVFQVKGNPKMLDLAVSRKLMLRAQASRTPLFLLRQAGEEEASSASTRWCVAPLQSQQHQDLKWGVGPMRHRLTLERNRTGQTGNWPVSWHSTKRTFSHAAQKASPTRYSSTVSTPADRPDIPSSLGQVMAFERAS